MKIWRCFICRSTWHDCGHREAEIIMHILGPHPLPTIRAKREAKHG